MLKGFSKVLQFLTIIVIAFQLLLNACAGGFLDDPVACAAFAKEHVFMVDPNGWCIDPRQQWDLPGKTNKISHIYRQALDPIQTGIRNWAATNQSSGPLRVVIFVHGGMNPYSASFSRMKDLSPLMLKDDCYPIFVVWDSDPFHAYGQHLVRIRQGEEHPIIGWATMPLMLASDLAKGLVRLPITYTGRVYNDIRTTELPYSDATKRWESFEGMIRTRIEPTNQLIYHPPSPELGTRTWPERTCRLGEYLITTPTKIVFMPMLDGMGTESWDIMLRRTRTMFERSDRYDVRKNIKKWQIGTSSANKTKFDDWLNYRPKNVEPGDSSTYGGRGAMAFFAKSLAEWSANPLSGKDGRSRDVHWELYGHSMGTIVINQMLRIEPDIKASRIVYMAAACSIQDFQGSVLPYLRTNNHACFYNLSLHRMAEREEYPLFSAHIKVPVFRDLIVRGSLLNWIDDFFAKPNAVTDRTLGAWENITSALPDIPQEIRGRTHFRCCDLEPMAMWKWNTDLEGQREPQIHGGFPNARFWNPNFFWPATTNSLPLLKE